MFPVSHFVTGRMCERVNSAKLNMKNNILTEHFFLEERRPPPVEVAQNLWSTWHSYRLFLLLVSGLCHMSLSSGGCVVFVGWFLEVIFFFESDGFSSMMPWYNRHVWYEKNIGTIAWHLKVQDSESNTQQMILENFESKQYVQKYINWGGGDSQIFEHPGSRSYTILHVWLPITAIASMYGIFTYIWLIFLVNVGNLAHLRWSPYSLSPFEFTGILHVTH